MDSRWQSRRVWCSPSLTNTSKAHLHGEPFSVESNWKMAKRLLSAIKIHTYLGREGREVVRSGPVPRVGMQSKGGIHTWKPALGKRGSEPLTEHPNPGVLPRETRPWPAGGSVG